MTKISIEFTSNNIIDDLTKNEWILNSIKEKNISGQTFEFFVLEVLKDYLHSQGKVILMNDSSHFYDAYLPEGFDDTSNPTYLEIKYMPSNKGIYWKILENECNRIAKQGVAKLLLILGAEFSVKSKENIYSFISARTDKSIVVWDIIDLYKRTSEFWPKNFDVIMKPDKVLVEKAILEKKSQEQVSSEYVERLAKLKAAYLNDELVLVLGAGVSIDADIPLWDDLIKNLLLVMINNKLKPQKKTFSKVAMDEIMQLAYKNMEESPLTQMRYIRNAFSSNDYKKLIHGVLYQNKPKINTALIKAICELCKPSRKHLGAKSLITYNFDDLLERALKSKGIEYRTIYREVDFSTPENLNIYHVHGYLPNDINEVTDVSLIFSEEDYHRVYRDSYCWSNIVQLNSFRDSTCLFVGCSLNDPNLRRLLDVAVRKDEEPRHFAILKRRRLVDNPESLSDSSILGTYESIDNNIRETYYRSIGINIIWVNDFDEVPSTLLELIRQNSI